MFNILYKFFKLPTYYANDIKKYNIYLVKDINKNANEYKNMINLLISYNFPLQNKSINIDGLKLKNIFRFIFWIIFYFFLVIFLTF